MGGGPRPGRTVRRGPAAVRTGGHRGTGAHRQGRKMEGEAWGSRFRPHQGMGGGVVAGQRR
jgi:hypothetical protein